jgi:hypothetical protein
LRNYPGNFSEETEEDHENVKLKMFGIQAETKTGHLPDMSSEHAHYTNCSE